MKLYDLNELWQQHAEQLVRLIDDDAEQSVIDEHVQALSNIDHDWTEKALNMGFIIKQFGYDLNIIQAEKKRLADKEKRLERTHDYLKSLLLAQMQQQGKSEVKNALITLKLRNNPYSVNVLDESLIPEQFKRTKTVVEIDKKALLAQRETLDIQGVTFEQKQSLSVR